MARHFSRVLFAVVVCATVTLVAQTDKLVRRAEQAYRSGKLDQAVRLLERAVRRDPSALPAHRLLGTIRAQRGQWDAAIDSFTQVLRGDPADAPTHYQLAKVYQAQGRWPESAESLSRALENQHPDRIRLMVDLSLALLESGRPGDAVARLRTVEAPADPPAAAQYHSVMAFALRRLDQPFDSLQSIERALKLDAANPRGWDFYLDGLLSTDQRSTALSVALQAQKTFPNHPDIQYQFGLAAHSAAESSFTKLALRNLKEAEPQDPRIAVLEGLLARQQRQRKEAVEAFSRAVAGGAADASSFLGILLREEKRYVEAEKALLDAAKKRPHDGRVALDLGDVLLSQGRVAEARESLVKAERYLPNNPRVHHLLSEIYTRLDESEKAAHHVRRLRELDQR